MQYDLVLVVLYSTESHAVLSIRPRKRDRRLGGGTFKRICKRTLQGFAKVAKGPVTLAPLLRSVSLFLCLCLCLSLSRSRCLSVARSLCRFVSCRFVSLSLCLDVSLSLYLSVSLFLYLSLSLSLDWPLLEKTGRAEERIHYGFTKDPQRIHKGFAIMYCFMYRQYIKSKNLDKDTDWPLLEKTGRAEEQQQEQQQEQQEQRHA